MLGLGAQFRPHAIADERLEGLPRLRNIPTLMWYRVYLPELLPEVDRVLYLDADTLVLGSLNELRNTDMSDFQVAAVDNVFESSFAHWPMTLGLPATGYFNSGVLLLNLASMRACGSVAKIVAVGRSSTQRLNWPDQDALNKVLHSSRLVLHPKWNCQSSLFYLRQAKLTFGREQLKDARKSPAIVHFEGAIKPWHRLSRHPYRSLYLYHRRQTPWPNVVLEGDTFLNAVLSFLPVMLTAFLLKLSFKVRTRIKRLTA